MLRTETELALLESHPPQLEGLLRRLHIATTRAARLANQLLSQARAEHERHNSAMRALRPQADRHRGRRGMGRALDGRRRRPRLRAGERARRRPRLPAARDARQPAGQRDQLRAAPAPASRSAPAPSHDAPACAILEVEDNGPGIPPPTASAPSSASSAATPAAPAAAWACPSCATSPATTARCAELLDGPGGVGLKVRVTFAPLDAPARVRLRARVARQCAGLARRRRCRALAEVRARRIRPPPGRLERAREA